MLVAKDEKPKEIWKLYTNESSIVDDSDVGLILIPPCGDEILRYTFALTFKANELE